jgi:hypothetical protein
MKKLKLLFLSLITLMLPLSVSSQEAESTFCGGTGTETDPYLICDATTLASLATYVNNGNGNQTVGIYYRLTADLDLQGWDNGDGKGWKPIGDNSTGNKNSRFQGIFDGNNHVVKNMTIARSGENYVGLFGNTMSATIKKLGVVNCSVSGQKFVAGLVGENYFTVIISNCYATGSVNGSDCVGGLVGSNYSTTIQNCYAIGNITGNNYAGGLVGYSSESTISNCYAGGSVNGRQRVGGLVGSTSSSIIQNCVAANDLVTGGLYVGRIAGEYSTVIRNSYALNTMLVNESVVSGGLADNINGADKTFAELQNFNFYNTANNWHDNTAWSITSSPADTEKTWRICHTEGLPF